MQGKTGEHEGKVLFAGDRTIYSNGRMTVPKEVLDIVGQDKVVQLNCIRQEDNKVVMEISNYGEYHGGGK